MLMILGLLLAGGGIGGGIGLWSVLSKTRWSAISQEGRQTVTIIACLCVILFIAGVTMLVAGRMKKNNADRLERIDRMESGGGQKGVCPNCGLNVTEETERCPRCGTKIRKEGKLWQEQ